MSTLTKTNRQQSEEVPVASSGSRLSAEDRRRQIVRVAMKLFSKKGFEGTTTKEIAAECQISEAMIFRHFATKHDLYAAILDEKTHEKDEIAFWEHLQAWAAEKNDQAIFYHFALRSLEKHRQDNSFMRLMFFSALEGHELSEMFYETRVQDVYRFLGDYITERQKDGRFRAMDPMLAARSFIGMVFYQSLTEQLFEKHPALVDKNELAAQITELYLSGMTIGETELQLEKSGKSRRRTPSK
ncbi:MAG: TetR/AcrR family transcriptional regulator [Blastocatellia bacterium]|nr:TetR/AcrR family transcriptional regulator [Blastocatellia bacterium]